METIRLSDKTVEMLQSVAIPLRDDFDSVIQRLVQCAHAGVPYSKEWNRPIDERADGLQSDGPASLQLHDLGHTKLVTATFGGKNIDNPNWNLLSRVAHCEAFKKLGDLDAVGRISGANVSPDLIEENGYHTIPQSGFSVQALSAPLCWNAITRLAEAIGTTVQIQFRWLDKPEAQNPGEVRELRYPV